MVSGTPMYKKCLGTLWCELYGMSQPRPRRQQWLNSEGWQWSSQLPSSTLGAGVTEAGRTDREFARAQSPYYRRWGWGEASKDDALIV